MSAGFFELEQVSPVIVCAVVCLRFIYYFGATIFDLFYYYV